MHPASRILTYLLAALAIPGLPFFMLLLALIAALPILARLRRSPFGLLWRTRWLLLVLLLGYAYSLPGEPLWPKLGSLSPSLEGVMHGGRQSLGLLVLLLWLDILVLAQSAESLLGGIYQLVSPFAAVGLDRGRFALRLGLTLKAIEGMERGRGNLIRLVQAEADAELPSRIRFQNRELAAVDFLMPAAMLASVFGLWLSA